MTLRSLRALALFLTLVLPTGESLSAQQEPALEPGSQIEVVSERLSGGIGVGRLVTLTRDTLTFVDSMGTSAVALEDIGQLRVNVGRDNTAINIATLTGAVLGAAIAPLTNPESYECESSLVAEDECDQEVPIVLVGALLGAGVVRILAKFALDERWVNVNLDRLIYRPGSELR